MPNALQHLDPFPGFDLLRREMFADGLFRAFRGKLPTTDIYTDDKALVIEAHLPKVEQKDITVSVDRDAVIIQAERHEQQEDGTRNYVIRESTGSFFRRFALPDHAETEGITAQFVDGVLKVTIPLAQADATHTVPVTGGAGQ